MKRAASHLLRHGRTCSGHPRLKQHLRSDERVVQILPVRVHRVNEPHLPSTRPMFDCFLSLNGVTDVIEALVIHEYLQAVLLCESLNEAFPMLESATRQIARDAGIENAVPPIGNEINPAASHRSIEARRGWPGQARP